MLFGNLKEEEIIVHTEHVKEEDKVIIEVEKEELMEEYEFEEENKNIDFEEEKNSEIEEETKEEFVEEKEEYSGKEEEKIIQEEKEKERKEEERKEEKEDKKEKEKEEKEKEKSKEEEKEESNKIKDNNEEKIEEEDEDIENPEEEEEKEIIGCEQLEKCELCNEESLNQNLCIKCNNLKGYYFLNTNSISREELRDKYIECVKEESKPPKFYFDQINEDFRLCYETCSSCDTGGNWEINNCKSCEKNYIPKPDIISTTNCVKKCSSYYYYTISNHI